MTLPPEPDPHDELRELAAALAAHAEWQQVTGASGLPAATAELARSRRGTEVSAPVATPDSERNTLWIRPGRSAAVTALLPT